MDASSITPGELLQLRDLVQSYCGIRVEESKLEFIRDRLAPVIESHGMSSLGAMCQALLREIAFNTNKIWNTVLPLVTINETYFFRERGQLDEFRDRIVPQVVAAKKDRQLKVLSAPCSTGEEPYTLAMLLDEAPVDLSSWRVEIVGFDIDTEAIEKARSAFYPHSAFRSTETRYRDKYFVAEGNGHRIVSKIASRVRFQSANILDLPRGPEFEGFDIIFCRNMLIYFDKGAQKRVVDRFYQMLNPSGFLFVGHSESLMTLDVNFVPRFAPQAIYYEKVAGTPAGR